MTDSLKIVRLTAENVKRLKAVEIEPDGTMQVVTGRNAQGKTSVLDAIWLALGGGDASRTTKRPIRDGEDTASVTLDLGDLIVERTWKGEKTTLTVKSADGAKYSGPQRMLDELVGRLSFDPLAFTRLSARDQTAALLDLVDLDVDLDELADERQRLYDERTQVGRDGKALGDPGPVDDSLPGEEQSASALLRQIGEAEESNRLRRLALLDRTAAKDEVERLSTALKSAQQALQDAEAKADAAPAETDTDAMRTELDGIEDTNAKIRTNNDAKANRDRRDQLRQQYDDLGKKIAAVDKRRTDALGKASFPVDGLGFDDDGVTYKGVPFSQASSAEQIRVSLAMAMALNPKLRVIRILDGSLLDDESMRMVAEQAASGGYQVWIERVADDSASAVVIEDGAVAS